MHLHLAMTHACTINQERARTKSNTLREPQLPRVAGRAVSRRQRLHCTSKVILAFNQAASALATCGCAVNSTGEQEGQL